MISELGLEGWGGKREGSSKGDLELSVQMETRKLESKPEATKENCRETCLITFLRIPGSDNVSSS